MTTNDLYAALMRPAVVQILRATGFSFARPAVIDSLTDLAIRYLLLIGGTTAANAFNNHNDHVPTTQDVRLAMAEIGALRPQMPPMEEAARGTEEVDGVLVPFEDMRGVRAFIAWAQGPVNKEIRRIAGFGDEIDVNEIAAGVDETEDYLTAMKKKHSKTGEESRYQGTLLGKDADLQPVEIAGGSVTKLSDWMRQRMSTVHPDSITSANAEQSQSPDSSDMSSLASTPLMEQT